MDGASLCEHNPRYKLKITAFVAKENSAACERDKSNESGHVHSVKGLGVQSPARLDLCHID